MSFKLDPKPTFAVVLSFPKPGGITDELSVTFRHKTTKQLQEFIAGTSGRGDLEILRDMAAEVEGHASDTAGFDEFCTALLDNYPAAGRFLFESYIRALTEARTKN